MSIRSHIIISRVTPAFLVGMAWWALMMLVPATRFIERGIQRAMHSVFFSDYQRAANTVDSAQPYVMLHLRAPDRSIAPFVVEAGDDPEKIFDSRPLSPSDCAVLLDNMKKAGVERVVIASPLAWQDADPFALDALEMVSAALQRCVTSAPVSRGAIAEPLPGAMQRASIPLTQVHGNFRTVPEVNRLAISNSFLGRETTWAGFSQIETEPSEEGKDFLLARWDNRVIFSSSLLAVLLREQINPTELVVEVGQAIHSPRTGHWWVIDEFGRSAVPKLTPPPADLLATQLIRPEPETLAKLKTHHAPVHLFQPNGDDAVLRRQQQLLPFLYGEPILLDRISWDFTPDMGDLLMAIFTWQAAMSIVHKRRQRMIALLALAGLWLVATRWGATWVSLSPSLLAYAVAWRLSKNAAKKPIEITSPIVVAAPTTSAPIKAPKAKPSSAKKTPRKAAKKAARPKKKS